MLLKRKAYIHEHSKIIYTWAGSAWNHIVSLWVCEPAYLSKSSNIINHIMDYVGIIWLSLLPRCLGTQGGTTRCHSYDIRYQFYYYQPCAAATDAHGKSRTLRKEGHWERRVCWELVWTRWLYVKYKICLAGSCAGRRASSITGWFLVGCEKEEHGRQYNTPKAGEEKGGE